MDVKHYGDVDGMDRDDGNAAVDDDDWCLSLQDRRRLNMDPQRASSPSRSIPEVRFLWLLVFLCLVSSIWLHGVKLFEAVVPRASIRRQLYGWEKYSCRIVGRWTLWSLQPAWVFFWYYWYFPNKLFLLFLAPFGSDTTGPRTMSTVSIVFPDPGENRHKRCVQTP